MMLRDFSQACARAASRHRFATDASVPDGLLVAALAMSEVKVRHQESAPALLGASLPWLVQSSPEELYFPKAFLSDVHLPWTPERTLALIPSLEFAAAVPTPVRVTQTASRNDPCPCGSARKYKRCCAA